MPTEAGSADTTGARTSSVRTLVYEGEGPVQRDDEDEDEDEDYTHQEEMNFFQLYGAPLGTQYDYQV
jgi:hypothetical protein